MEGHIAAIGTVFVGLTAVGVGAWPAFERRSQTLHRSPGIWKYGSAGMIGLVILGAGLVLVGSSFIFGSGGIARVMIWGGVGMAVLGGAAFVVNPRVRSRY